MGFVCRSRSRGRAVKNGGSSNTDDPSRLFPERVSVNETALGRGPRAALKFARLEDMTDEARLEWLESSRVDSVIGSCQLSIKFVRSGYRCYAGFASKSVRGLSQRVMSLAVFS